MRLICSVVLSLALATMVFAQRGGHGGGFSRGGGGGFARMGGGMMRGGGFSHGGGLSRGGFAQRPIMGGFHGGNNGFRGPYRGTLHGGYRNYGYRRYGSRFIGYYGWPFYGYGYGLGFGYGYDPFWSDYSTPTVNYSYPYYSGATYAPDYSAYAYPPPEPALQPPPVVYEALPPPPARQERNPNEPISYLIAFNDHNIKLALAYWTENHNLRYVTMQHEIKTAPLITVDRDLSMRLNQERRITFSLPGSGG